MNILSIIPARGGSKDIPRKNIQPLAGKPLIAYTINSALKSKYVGKVVVSTEDEKITEVSKTYGAEVIKRPKELAKGETPTIDVIFHAIDALKVKNSDLIVLLQPTSPLRTAKDIDNAIELFLSNECESVISVCEVKHSPYWCLKIENGYLKPLFKEKHLKTRRQDLPKAYTPNGAVYISTSEILYKYKSFYCSKTLSYIMSPERSIDIDTEIDFMLAELLMRKYGLE